MAFLASRGLVYYRGVTGLAARHDPTPDAASEELGYYLLHQHPHASDVATFLTKVRNYLDAETWGRSFYAVHREAYEERLEQARRHGGPPPGYWERVVEYPPISIIWLAIPERINGPPPRGPFANREQALQAYVDHGDRYVLIYRGLQAAVDVLAFALIVTLLLRVAPRQSGGDLAWRLAVYVVCGIAMADILYDRFDHLLGTLLLASVLLLTTRVHYAVSFAVLAVAVNLKLAPLMLVPLWVVGATPVVVLRGWSAPGGLWRLAAALAVRLFAALGLTVLCVLPFLIQYGWDSVAFLTYLTERGIHLESVYGSILLVMRNLGYPIRVVLSYESFNLESDLAPMLASLSGVLALVAVLGTAVVFAWPLLRGAVSERGDGHEAGSTVAQKHSVPFVCAAVLSIVLGIATSKVFSPQFLLWLLPLVPVVVMGAWHERALQAGFVVVCIVTTLIFPYLFGEYVIQAQLTERTETTLATFHGPTDGAAAMLIARNVLFLLLVVPLLVYLLGEWRRRVHEPG